MRRDLRKKLLADYAVALIAERESWERLQEPGLSEAERCRTLAEWKQIAAELKALVRQLRDAPAASPSAVALPASECPPAAEGDASMDAAPAPATSKATESRRPFHVHCLLATLRLLATCRNRLEPYVPRPGSL